MNKFLLAGLVFLILSSCKKSYTCSCTTTAIYESSNGYLATVTANATQKAFSEKMTKKEATAACNAERTVIESNVTNWDTNNGGYTLKSDESITTSCSLK